MNIYEITMLAVALAIDAMLVSFSYGIIICKNRVKNSVLLSFSFGFFQFLMPLIGGFLTGYIYNYLKLYSKWIVFIIFLILGMKFLKEAFSNNKEEIDCISFLCILWLALATSIDALGAGVSLRFLNSDIFRASVLIGIITLFLSLFSFYAGNIFCKLNKKYFEIIGALLLIYLAIKSTT